MHPTLESGKLRQSGIGAVLTQIFELGTRVALDEGPAPKTNIKRDLRRRDPNGLLDGLRHLK
jgi:hypothetical protein